MTGNEARKLFLDYFQKKDHQIIRSSSLVPGDDPTLLFTNAGMVQFKRTFLGEEKRKYVRAASSQKCVRAGGKHNDLENVGYTARHHTFFEMLGNFSFGDYFKETAIEYAWDLILNGYDLSTDNLWVSVFREDEESFNIWHDKMGVPLDRIARLGEKDNFWAMGDTGPCGPCSEIHVDRGEGFGCGRPDCDIACDCDRFLEIWNLVFMQYNRDASGNMTPLPKPSIDTGMGLERIASVKQDTRTNYDTDLFMPIIRKVEMLSEKKLGDSGQHDVAMKVIADHSRAAAFLINDGVIPSNEGRGYVLRRVMRRAIRYGRNIGLNKPFLCQTAAEVLNIMAPAYPELKESEAFITNIIENEEIRFSETLDTGLRLLNDTLSDIKAKGESIVPGDIIFKLYDTFGFPVDIVRDVVRDENMTLDMDGFHSSMEDQRIKSRSVVEFKTIGDAYKNLSGQGIMSKFIGDVTASGSAATLLIVKDGVEIPAGEEGQDIELVAESTPFYGESGGQVGDTGRITSDSFEMKVTDTIKDPLGLIIHKGKVISGKLRKGENIQLSVDTDKRKATALNHTATHILHAALRQVLGTHVKQAGSLVSPERLRFDFTHFSQVDRNTLDRIEMIVNSRIRENAAVTIDEMDIEAAMKTGATALFNEKYGDRVRVVAISDFSRELCGGTHTERTGDIGFFRIVNESSVASGVRRIEAVTGEKAVLFAQENLNILNTATALLKERTDTVLPRIEKILAEQKSHEKEIERLKAKMATMTAGSGEDDFKTINGIKVVAKKVSIDRPAALREIADKFRDKIKSGIVVLGTDSGEKAMLIVVVTKDLTGRFNAGGIIKELAAVIGGSGGGRPDMAQAGGPDREKLNVALEKVYEIVGK